YFITICIHQRECMLGEVVEGQMILNEFGRCVNQYWEDLPTFYPQLSLGEWVVMPNHVHRILIIKDTVGAIHESPLHESPVGVIHELPLHELPLHESPMYKRSKMLLSKIIGRFKMNSGKQINLIRNLP